MLPFGLLHLKSIIQILLVVAANVASLPFGSRYLDLYQQSSFMAEIPSPTSQNFILAPPEYSFRIFKLDQTPTKPFYQSCSSTTFDVSFFSLQRNHKLFALTAALQTTSKTNLFSDLIAAPAQINSLLGWNIARIIHI